MTLESSVSWPTCVTDDGVQTFVCVYLFWSVVLLEYPTQQVSFIPRSCISSAQRPQVRIIISQSPTSGWIRQPYHTDSIAQTIKPSSGERKPASPENHAEPWLSHLSATLHVGTHCGLRSSHLCLGWNLARSECPGGCSQSGCLDAVA